jgi:hypothetical protein
MKISENFGLSCSDSVAHQRPIHFKIVPKSLMKKDPVCFSIVHNWLLFLDETKKHKERG